MEDKPGAKPLLISEGRIEFNKVEFSYNLQNQCLKNITFSVPPGKTYAVVMYCAMLFVLKL